MHLDSSGRRTTSFPVATANYIGVALVFPVIEPRQRWYAVVRCDGYRDLKTPSFELGAGWLACPPTALGAITVTKDRQ